MREVGGVRELKTLVVIPARGGSKGLPGKNKLLLHGRPLVWWTLRFAEELAVGPFVLSTDDQDILGIGHEFHSCLSLVRPLDLASDKAGDQGYLLHALGEAEGIQGKRYDRVLLLQPTAPARRIEDVRQALRLHASMPKAIASAVWSVQSVPSKFHHRKQIVFHDGNYVVERFTPYPPRRQDLSDSYVRSGDFYIIGRDALQDAYLIGDKLEVFSVNGPSINIDTQQDFLRAERELIVKDNRLIGRDELSL